MFLAPEVGSKPFLFKFDRAVSVALASLARSELRLDALAALADTPQLRQEFQHPREIPSQLPKPSTQTHRATEATGLLGSVRCYCRPCARYMQIRSETRWMAFWVFWKMNVITVRLSLRGWKRLKKDFTPWGSHMGCSSHLAAQASYLKHPKTCLSNLV